MLARLKRSQHAISIQAAYLSISSRSSPLSVTGGVHGTRSGAKSWRNKPLFRREGDTLFRTGAEAAELLIKEVKRRDAHEKEVCQVFETSLRSLAPVFERLPKLAFVAKEFLEPERIVQFRVSWIDDSGTYRVNRGFRVQYSSSLGPFEGGLHFAPFVNASLLKSMALARVFTNGIAGHELGGAAGGADFEPRSKSEAEIQRFSQAFMTEIHKYIGPDQDMPGVGTGVGSREIGYLYGQYKRLKISHAQKGRGLLWGGMYPFPQAPGWGVAHMAKRALEDKGDSLEGKRCLITGSGKMSLHVAEKLIEFGAIPLTLSDTSGHIYEPDGIDISKLKTIQKIKSERGARIGRYIVSSTTAQYQEPENLFSIPADLVFLCAAVPNQVDASTATLMADQGVKGVFEGTHMPSTNDAITVYRKRQMLHGSHFFTLAIDSICNGIELSRNPPEGGDAGLDERIRVAADNVFVEAKSTAKEFNMRGDLHAGAIIAGFLRVGDSVIAQGAV